MAQTCQAAGGTLGRNQLTAETNGTYGVGTAANQSFALDNPSVTTYPYRYLRRALPTSGILRTTGAMRSRPDGPHGHAAHPTPMAVSARGTAIRGTPEPGHGPATDRYLVVNAALAPGVFYRQTITGLSPGTNYEFGTWVLNLNNRAGSSLIRRTSRFSTTGSVSMTTATGRWTKPARSRPASRPGRSRTPRHRPGCRTDSCSTAGPRPPSSSCSATSPRAAAATTSRSTT